MADNIVPINPVVPATSALDGHDAKGRFTPGNKISRGNPHAKSAQAWRKVWDACIKKGDIAAIYQKLLEKAKAGDTYAVKLYLEYSLGRPPADATIESADGNQSITISLGSKS